MSSTKLWQVTCCQLKTIAWPISVSSPMSGIATKNSLGISDVKSKLWLMTQLVKSLVFELCFICETKAYDEMMKLYIDQNAQVKLTAGY